MAMKVEKPKSVVRQLEDLKKIPFWLTWHTVIGKDGKPKKVPIAPASGRNASPTNPKHWAVRSVADERAATLYETNKSSGLGIALGPISTMNGFHLVGIDLDNCFDKEGFLLPRALGVFDRFDTYAELSPSGDGLHLLMFVRSEDVAALIEQGLLSQGGGKAFSVGTHIEIALYCDRRYFTVTLDVFEKRKHVRQADLEDLKWLLSERGPEFLAQHGKDIATKKDAKGAGSNSTGRDESGSGYAHRFFLRCFREGLSEDQAVAAIEKDDGKAGEWWGRTDWRQHERAIGSAYQVLEKSKGAIKEAFAELGLNLSKRDIEGLRQDHEGAVEVLTRLLRQTHRYDHDIGSWFAFDRAIWRPCRQGEVRNLSKRVCAILSRIDRAVKTLSKINSWEAVERAARSEPTLACTSDIWDTHPMLLGTPSGHVDLRTGELVEADPGIFISQSTSVHPIPLSEFHPERDCPTWMAFIEHSVGGDEDASRFLQTYAGYCLTGETSEQKILFVHGRGATGKSTFLNTVAGIMGDYAKNVASSTLTKQRFEGHPEELARLKGCRLAWVSETKKGSEWADDRIKSLSGGDTITARLMRQNSFEYRPVLKLIVVGNHSPSVDTVDDAIRRRLIIFPFQYAADPIDPELHVKLQREVAGILSWLIQGCLLWQRDGLVVPTIAQNATCDYFDDEDEDDLWPWISECCDVGVGYNDTVENLHASHTNHAVNRGSNPLTKHRSFPAAMKRRGFRSFKKEFGIRGRGYAGIRVRAHPWLRNYSDFI